MDTTVIILVVVVVLLLLALAALGAVNARRRRSEKLQERFGPEYDRSVDERGDRRSAEAELAAREKRVRDLDVRELRPEERERFEASWSGIQRDFVDDPVRAVRSADSLVADIMRTRGYPVDDFDRRAEDLSVEHPDVVHRYREARAVREETEHGTVDTERQRHAVTSYRSLVEALLGTKGRSPDGTGSGRDGTGADRDGRHAEPASGRGATTSEESTR